MLNGSKQVKDLQAWMDNHLKPLTDRDNFNIRLCLRILNLLKNATTCSYLCGNFRSQLSLFWLFNISYVHDLFWLFLIVIY